MIIAIDGPSASGKSTTAKGVASRLSITHLNTGAMYRAVTWAIREHGIDIRDKSKLDEFLNSVKISFDQFNNICISGKDVSKEISSTDISIMVSSVSAIPEIREKMVQIQRIISGKKDCVLEGRDIGTVVFPNAEYKFYLVADTLVRAKRRYLELKENGENCTLDAIIMNINDRDERDSTRKHSPLLQAEDAILIDTSKLTLDEQIEKIVNIVIQ